MEEVVLSGGGGGGGVGGCVQTRNSVENRVGAAPQAQLRFGMPPTHSSQPPPSTHQVEQATHIVPFILLSCGTEGGKKEGGGGRVECMLCRYQGAAWTKQCRQPHRAQQRSWLARMQAAVSSATASALPPFIRLRASLATACLHACITTAALATPSGSRSHDPPPSLTYVVAQHLQPLAIAGRHQRPLGNLRGEPTDGSLVRSV